MKKSELRKIIREVISEQLSEIDHLTTNPSSVALPPKFSNLGTKVNLTCPDGYRFIDNLPNGLSNPSLHGITNTGQGIANPSSPLIPIIRLQASYCVPMGNVTDLNPDLNPEDADNLSPNPNPGIPIGKPGTEGGTKVPAQRRKR